MKEGDFVTAGQPLAHMQIDTLEASHDEAKARHQQAVAAVATAEAQVAVRQSDRQAVLALVAQRQSELEAAQRRLARSPNTRRCPTDPPWAPRHPTRSRCLRPCPFERLPRSSGFLLPST